MSAVAAPAPVALTAMDESFPGSLASDASIRWGGGELRVADGLSRIKLSPTRAQEEADVLRTAPSLPGGTTLFLSAMLGMGGFVVVRSSVKHLNFAALPEWYHSGGPLQVGHAVPFDGHARLAFAPAVSAIQDSSRARSWRDVTVRVFVFRDEALPVVVRGPPVTHRT